MSTNRCEEEGTQVACACGGPHYCEDEALDYGLLKQRDSWQEEARRAYVNRDYWRARAERAEADRDDQIRQAEIQAHRALDAEAALARVRALCDDEPNWNGPEVNSEVRWFANDIRAAIDGDQ